MSEQQKSTLEEREAALRNLVTQFGPYVAMLAFVRSDQSISANGTASFINIKGNKLVVTCAHVVEEFRKNKEADPGMWMALLFKGTGSVIALQEERMVDCGNSKRLDLATFALVEPNLIEEFGKQYFKCPTWPPARSHAGDVMAFVGFPGQGRRQMQQGLEINYNGLAINISAVSDAYITSVDEDESRVVVACNKALGEFRDLGGMSGSAVYEIGEDHAHLIGFYCEGGQFGGVGVPVKAVHADFLREDGKLDWLRVCW
jgi:hypothetical protein